MREKNEDTVRFLYEGFLWQHVKGFTLMQQVS